MLSMSLIEILEAGSVFIVGLLLGLFVIKQRAMTESAAQEKAEKMFAEAQQKGREFVDQAKEKVSSKKEQFVAEQEEFMAQLNNMERMFEVKLNSSKKREEKNTQLKKSLDLEEQTVREWREAVHRTKKEIADRLMASTGLSGEQVKSEVMKSNEKVFLADAELRLQQNLEWAQECLVRDAKNALAESMCRFSDITIIEDDDGRVKVSHDEIKGRIVGRGGRAIAFFEELFGVDVIFNDEPNIIILSCFNIVQREIARAALERLMREKNITEEVILRAKTLAEQDINRMLQKTGEEVLRRLGLSSMPVDFAKLVGRLKFRTSYGQNILRHSYEVGYFSKLIAGAIGADERTAFLGGFFHDIGKAIDQEVGGSHDVLSKEILEKYGFSWEITHAAWTHHNAIPQETIEAKIVQAADAISAGRPGARAESVERYLAKIKDLEATTLSFPGVKKAFTIHAGREVRAMVDSEKVKDADMTPLAKNIAAKVQEKGGYPGRIKITTIRTTKAVDYAK